jgi:hypothetical protein
MRPLIFGLVLLSSLASADPQRLTYRYLHVGRALGQFDVTTYRLEVDGNTAQLVVERGLTDPKQHPAEETGPYLPEKPELYKGTATTTKTGIDLSFELAKDTSLEHLSCRWKTVNIAAADAVRIKSKHGECDGDRGVFSPAKTTAVRALVCGDDTPFVFAQGPGVERAGLSEECYIQGAGLRAIRPDGAILRVSPKRR